MFYIISVGLFPEQITKEAIDIVSNCDEVYIDNYTNIYSQGQIKDLEKIVSKKIVSLNREELEQEQRYLKNNCCLLVIGNALSATTHYTIKKDASNKNISTKIVSGISIFNYRGYSGLYEYKFGKTTSIVYPEKNYKPTSFYKTIIDNININAHSLCLLDIKTHEKRFMTFVEACEILKDIDTQKILENKRCVLLAGMGSNNQKIISFIFKDYIKIKCDVYPQSLIICSSLNNIEKEALDEYRL
jgi:diphthine synthase